VSGTPDQVPLTAMDGSDPELFGELIAEVRRLALIGAFTGGAAVEDFETDFASWCEAPYAVGVSSGTEALVLALRALGIGAGDDVVVPANSFIATAEAVSLVGARPVFADVDLDTQLVTGETLAAALTPQTRCLIPVHLFGRTVEMQSIMAFAQEQGLCVIEDTAQAHGARYRGMRAGTIGDVGTFSFYPAKNLGAWGDAGAVVTAREELAERVRLMRSHGERPRYHHRVLGTTGRLDAIQAAVLRIKLARLERWNRARRNAAARLREALGEMDGMTPPPAATPDGDHVYHQFVIRVRKRDALRQMLGVQGVASGVHYPIPIHRSQAYGWTDSQCDVAPNASALASEVLSLPMFPTITNEQIERIATAVRECVALLHSGSPLAVGST
jgi:dTDP-3-amino-3,4,6-trideoxy-alpha-D-glucose transaminase